MSDRFTPAVVRHETTGWWAYVNAEGATPGYWRSPRETKWGALFAATWRAKWLNWKDRRSA